MIRLIRDAAFAGTLLAALCCNTPAPPPTTEGFVSGLYYQAVGAGRDTVVVLHGGPGLHSRYLAQPLAPLTRDHVLIFYDQRGRGRSAFPADSLSLSAAADVADLEAIRSFFHLDRLTLIGHGWGAGLAALYAMEHGDRVSRLLLISPMLPRAESLWGLVFQRAGGRDTSGLVGLAAARLARSDRNDPVGFCHRYWGAYLSPATVRDRVVIGRLGPSVCDAPREALRRVELINRRVTGSLGAWNWLQPGLLGSIAAPTLIVQGVGARVTERDESATWLGSAREWAATLPHARLLIVGSVPQFPWFDAARQFDAAAHSFLRGDWPPDAHAIDRADSLRARAHERDGTVTSVRLPERLERD